MHVLTVSVVWCSKNCRSSYQCICSSLNDLQTQKNCWNICTDWHHRHEAKYFESIVMYGMNACDWARNRLTADWWVLQVLVSLSTVQSGNKTILVVRQTHLQAQHWLLTAKGLLGRISWCKARFWGRNTVTASRKRALIVLYNKCIGKQKSCPCMKLTLLRNTIAVKVQCLVASCVALTTTACL